MDRSDKTEKETPRMRETLARLAKQQSRPRPTTPTRAAVPPTQSSERGDRATSSASSTPVRRPSTPPLTSKTRPLGTRETSQTARPSTQSPNATSTTTQMPRAASRSTGMEDGSRPTPRGADAGTLPTRRPTPLPPRADVRSARTAPPPADALESDRILELPTLRSRARQQTPQRAQADVRTGATDERAGGALVAPRGPLPLTGARRASAPGGMQSIGDALQGYVSVLAERRRQRNAEGGESRRARTDRERALGPLQSVQEDACPICGGAGWLRVEVPFGDRRFGQPVPCVCKEQEMEERHRREEERRQAELDRFFSLHPFADKTFEAFEPKTPGLREAFAVARDYADDPQGWLLLMGSYGTGKTHLAAAIAHERLAAGSSVYFAVVPELLDHLRSAFAPGSELSYDEMFDKIREVELLVLDDLGAENGTAWATEKLFQLINYRYNYRMPTVITTNNQLHSRMDERVRSRLGDLSLVRQISIKAPDYRPRNTRGARRD